MNSGYIVLREPIEVVNLQSSGLGFTNISAEKFKDIVRTEKMVLMTVELPPHLFPAPLSAVATSVIVDFGDSQAYMISGYSPLLNRTFALSLGVNGDYPNDVVFELTKGA